MAKGPETRPESLGKAVQRFKGMRPSLKLNVLRHGARQRRYKQRLGRGQVMSRVIVRGWLAGAIAAVLAGWRGGGGATKGKFTRTTPPRGTAAAGYYRDNL